MFPLFRRSLRRRRHGNSSGHHREPSIRRSLYPICLNHETGWDSHSDIFTTSIPSTRPALFRGCRRPRGPAGSPTHSPSALTSYPTVLWSPERRRVGVEATLRRGCISDDSVLPETTPQAVGSPAGWITTQPTQQNPQTPANEPKAPTRRREGGPRTTQKKSP